MNEATRHIPRALLPVALALCLPLSSAADDTASLRAEIERQKAQLDEEMARLQERMDALKKLERRVSALEAAQGAAAETAPATPRMAAAPAPEDEPGAAALRGFRDNDQPLTGQDLVDDDFPKSWPLFGSDYRMSFGGYVKLDYLQDFDGIGDRFQFVTQTIPVEGSPGAGTAGYMNLFARETRFSFEVRNTAPGATPQKYFVEMDFYQEDAGPFNQYPRLRHAYFVYGNVLAGRTWGILTDTRAIAPLIDFAAGDSLAATRAAQIRWEQRLSGGLKWAVGLQMQEFPGIENAFDQPGRASALLPLLEGRIEKRWGASHVMLGGALGQLRWDGQGEGPDATAPQWALLLTGRIAVGHGGSFLLNSSYGRGSGTGVAAFVGTGAAVLTPTGELDTMPAWSIASGYTQAFTDRLSSSIYFARGEIEPSELRAPDSMKASTTAHVNLLWDITPNLTTGIEFMWGRRTNTDDRSGTARRLQLMTKYGF